MRKKIATILLWTMALCAPFGAGIFAFLHVGSWLFLADELPGRIDVVCTFAGENARINYARELMNVFPGAHWVASDDVSRSYVRILGRSGYDMTRISTFDTCKNTLSEVIAFRDWFAALQSNKATDHGEVLAWQPIQNNELSVVFVSSPYHMRRIQLMVKKKITDKSLRCHFCPVPLDRYNWSKDDIAHWWREPDLRNFVQSEIGKIVYFWLFT